MTKFSPLITIIYLWSRRPSRRPCLLQVVCVTITSWCAWEADDDTQCIRRRHQQRYLGDFKGNTPIYCLRLILKLKSWNSPTISNKHQTKKCSTSRNVVLVLLSKGRVRGINTRGRNPKFVLWTGKLFGMNFGSVDHYNPGESAILHNYLKPNPALFSFLAPSKLLTILAKLTG